MTPCYCWWNSWWGGCGWLKPKYGIGTKPRYGLSPRREDSISSEKRGVELWHTHLGSKDREQLWTVCFMAGCSNCSQFQIARFCFSQMWWFSADTCVHRQFGVFCSSGSGSDNCGVKFFGSNCVGNLLRPSTQRASKGCWRHFNTSAHNVHFLAVFTVQSAQGDLVTFGQSFSLVSVNYCSTLLTVVLSSILYCECSVLPFSPEPCTCSAGDMCTRVYHYFKLHCAGTTSLG